MQNQPSSRSPVRCYIRKQSETWRTDHKADGQGRNGPVEMLDYNQNSQAQVKCIDSRSTSEPVDIRYSTFTLKHPSSQRIFKKADPIIGKRFTKGEHRHHGQHRRNAVSISIQSLSIITLYNSRDGSHHRHPPCHQCPHDGGTRGHRGERGKRHRHLDGHRRGRHRQRDRQGGRA